MGDLEYISPVPNVDEKFIVLYVPKHLSRQHSKEICYYAPRGISFIRGTPYKPTNHILNIMPKGMKFLKRSNSVRSKVNKCNIRKLKIAQGVLLKLIVLVQCKYISFHSVKRGRSFKRLISESSWSPNLIPPLRIIQHVLKRREDQEMLQDYTTN